MVFGKHFGVIFVSISQLDRKKQDYGKRTFRFRMSIHTIVYSDWPTLTFKYRTEVLGLIKSNYGNTLLIPRLILRVAL